MHSATVRLIKLARQIETYGTGYDQSSSGRKSCFDFVNGKILKNKAVDCSMAGAGVVDIAYGTNLHSGTFWTGNAAERLVSTGFFTMRKFSKLSDAVPGGFLITPGHHMVTVLDKGECLSPEYNEKGSTTGGKPGDQGNEVKIRKLYVRSGGWKYNVVPVSPSVFKGRSLANFAYKRDITDANNRLKIVSSWDGIRWAWMMRAIDKWFTELPVIYDSRGWASPKDHAFVVLGGTIAQMDRRLSAVLPALKANPSSFVVVSGGVKRGKIAEWEYMTQWLTKNGVPQMNIIQEVNASSTIGNAMKSVPLMLERGIKSYTLVSDKSHLLRASVLFLAARVQIEMRVNKNLPLKSTKYVIAFKDSGNGASRAEIMREAAYILGVLTQYNNAK